MRKDYQLPRLTSDFSVPWSFFSSCFSSVFASLVSLLLLCFIISVVFSRISGGCSAPGLCRGVAFGVTRGDAFALLISLSVGFLAESVDFGVVGFFGVLWTFGSGGFESFVTLMSPTRSVMQHERQLNNVNSMHKKQTNDSRLRMYLNVQCWRKFWSKWKANT